MNPPFMHTATYTAFCRFIQQISSKHDVQFFIFSQFYATDSICPYNIHICITSTLQCVGSVTNFICFKVIKYTVIIVEMHSHTGLNVQKKTATLQAHQKQNPNFICPSENEIKLNSKCRNKNSNKRHDHKEYFECVEWLKNER